MRKAEMQPVASRRFFVCFFWVLIFASFIKPLVDPDMWMHLKAGQYICLHGLPAVDVFSWTSFGHPWLNHEWLSQVLLWQIYRLGGFDALIFLPAFLSVITLGFVYNSCEGRLVLAVYVMLLMWTVYGFIVSAARPYLFTFLLTAVCIYILESVKSRRMDSRWFFLFPALMLFWVNLHGAYMAGIAILGLYAVGEWLGLVFLKNTERNLDRKDLKRLVLAILLCVAAALVNPFGSRALLYPFLAAAGHAHLSYVGEWQSPNFHLVVLWPFLLVFSGGLWVCAADRKKPDLTGLLLFLASGFMGFYSVRHIPLFAIVSAPVIARHTLSAFSGTRYRAFLSGEGFPGSWTLRRSLAAVFFLSFAILAALVWTVAQTENNRSMVERIFPVKAVDHIMKAGLNREKIYNDYDWGGYLIWRGIPVFMDGRGEAYEKDFMKKYIETLFAPESWRKMLNDYHVRYLLLKRSRALTTVLAEAADWKRVYQDDIAAIFVRV